MVTESEEFFNTIKGKLYVHIYSHCYLLLHVSFEERSELLRKYGSGYIAGGRDIMLWGVGDSRAILGTSKSPEFMW